MANKRKFKNTDSKRLKHLRYRSKKKKSKDKLSSYSERDNENEIGQKVKAKDFSQITFEKDENSTKYEEINIKISLNRDMLIIVIIIIA